MEESKVCKNILPEFINVVFHINYPTDFSAGLYKCSHETESINTAYIFSRKDLSRPVLQLPGANKPVVAVHFCPLVFSLRGSKSDGFFKLPYRLIFAVATLNSLYIYDTESVAPLAILAGLHYAAITDIAWSPDGKYLALSSQDGYCTLVEFQSDELGSPIPSSDGKNTTSNVGETPSLQKPEEMVIQSVVKDTDVVIENNQTDKQTEPVATTTPAPTKLAKRRITPIAIDP
ncbi:unnamed protein product [Amaranthus hypochondriacus]